MMCKIVTARAACRSFSTVVNRAGWSNTLKCPVRTAWRRSTSLRRASCRRLYVQLLGRTGVRVGGGEKCVPRVDSVGKVVRHRARPVVGGKPHRSKRPDAGNDGMVEGWQLEHVDVVVAALRHNVHVPYVQVLVSHSHENNRAVALAVLLLAVLRRRARAPPPMRAIDWADTAGKSARLVPVQDDAQLRVWGRAQVRGGVLLHDKVDELVDGDSDGGLAQSCVLVRAVVGLAVS